MNILSSEERLCPCCMEEHAVQTITAMSHNTFKGTPIEYNIEYYYCDRANEAFEDEQQISRNDIAMKNAYRKKMDLLTSYQIAAIRARYGISQGDLCLLLGWGGKTITRYESHQVQDIAHDTILRKIDSDPEWFLELLDRKKGVLTRAAFAKYAEAAGRIFEESRDQYLKRAILSRYAGFVHDSEASGGAVLSLNVVADMIRYFANSQAVTKLFLVKLMKMLWYADALSYKRRGRALSGLVYRALPMGAVPVAYELLIDLSSVHYEEIDMGEGTGYRFLPTEDKEYLHLALEDIEILEAVVRRFGGASKNEIVEAMHREDAYCQTALNDVIEFKYASTLRM